MYNVPMRTTVEMKPEHRAKLLETAAKRGQKGFSSVLAEAIDVYLESQKDAVRRRKRVLALRGVLRRREAEQLRRRVVKIREFWK